jgi:hypothetical protein
MIRKSVGSRLGGANRNSVTDFQRDAGWRGKTATQTAVLGWVHSEDSSSRCIYRENLVPRAGLEPTCGCPRWILSHRHEAD